MTTGSICMDDAPAGLPRPGARLRYPAPAGALPFNCTADRIAVPLPRPRCALACLPRALPSPPSPRDLT